jgi:hypothetical protein
VSHGEFLYFETSYRHIVNRNGFKPGLTDCHPAYRQPANGHCANGKCPGREGADCDRTPGIRSDRNAANRDVSKVCAIRHAPIFVERRRHCR